MGLNLDFPRPSTRQVEALAAHSPATIHEAMGKRGAMDSGIKPLKPGLRLCGPALTVDCPPGDNLTIHAAIERASPGDVLVVDCKGFVEAGPFGEVMAGFCLKQGIAGLVVDGCVRDGAILRGMSLPVFSRGLSMKGTTKKLLGSVGAPILCGGVRVLPGDIVAGDDDGIVVVPMAEATAAAEASARRVAYEEGLVEKIAAGASTIDLLELRALLK